MPTQFRIDAIIYVTRQLVNDRVAFALIVGEQTFKFMEEGKQTVLVQVTDDIEGVTCG